MALLAILQAYLLWVAENNKDAPEQGIYVSKDVLVIPIYLALAWWIWNYPKVDDRPGKKKRGR